jgi:RimJ/RimL family protein N-acetyltransferase
MKAGYLESDRLYYKPLSKVHLSEEYVKWMNDDDVNRYLESGGDYSIEKLEVFLEEQQKKEILFWAIHLKNTNKHIGNLKIDPIDSESNSGEYGIMMGDKNEWGKGYAKEASKAIIDYCFEVLKLAKITLGVVEINASAVKLYEKLGFSECHRIKDFGIYDNEKSDSIRMLKNNDR